MAGLGKRTETSGKRSNYLIREAGEGCRVGVWLGWLSMFSSEQPLAAARTADANKFNFPRTKNRSLKSGTAAARDRNCFRLINRPPRTFASISGNNKAISLKFMTAGPSRDAAATGLPTTGR
ncbi:unnamed protein product [Xylocopa violacea]|uniref:Uncharacterized protein n=1 Tax=Xylocopa violacea TaxID=135666 RepID=A0ABP1NPF6_XYLVO